MVCLPAGPGSANDQPIARAEVSPDKVVVGSEVTLSITVLVPTWFLKPPVYPSVEMESVVTVSPSESSYNITEDINGSNWTGIVREYKLYPMGRGTFSLRKKQIGITHADPQTRKPILSKLPLPELRFAADVPAGAENLNPFLAGSSFELTQKLSQEADIYRPGDAVERRVTARLKGMPSLFIPTLLLPHEEQGVSIYPGTPSTDDAYGKDKEAVTGVRKEAITYVFERGGTYAFPPLTLRWWNTKTEQVETAKIPAIEFQVKKTFLQYVKDLPRLVVFAAILGVLGLILFIIYFHKSILRVLISSWTRFYRSEPYAFLGAIFRVLFSDLRTAYLGILGWKRRIGPDESKARDTRHSNAFLALEASLYGPDVRKASSGLALRGKLVSELFTIRSRIHAKQRLRDTGVGRLNPV
jgi:hypothetical protein